MLDQTTRRNTSPPISNYLSIHYSAIYDWRTRSLLQLYMNWLSHSQSSILRCLWKSEVYEKNYQIFNKKNLTTMRIFQQWIKTSLKKPSKKLQTLLRKLFRKLIKLRMLKSLKRKLMLLIMKVSKLKQYLKYWDCSQQGLGSWCNY